MHRKLLVLLFFLLATTLVAASDGNKEKKQLQQLSSKIQSIQKNLQSANKKVRRLESALEKSERKLARTKKAISSTNEKINAGKSALKALQQQQTELQQKSTSQRQAMAKQLNLSYRMGREPTLKMLLNQQDPALLGRTMRYHKYFLQARADKLNEFLDTLSALATTETDINLQLDELTHHKSKLAEQLNTQLEQQQTRTQALAALNHSVKTDAQKLTKLLLEKQRLESIITELTQAIAAIATPQSYQPFSKRKGKLIWPVKGAVKKRFGQARNVKITWDGWLIAANEGASVKAIHSGRVVFADYLRGHGLLIVVDHGSGFMSLYAHNQVLLAETGDWINGGSPIAKVGLTGGQNQSGLYFEIRHKGKPTNPAHWLTKRS